LKKYPVIFLLGNPEMTDDLQVKLAHYVKDGGTLVLNAMQSNDTWKELLGIKMTPQENRWYKGPGILRVADSSEWVKGPTFNEKRYFYYILDSLPKNAEVLAINPERNHPLIAKVPVGKGSVYFVAIQYMQESSGIYRPYGLTESCKELIRTVLEPHQKVFVTGQPLEYVVRQSKDRLLVLAVNNKPEAWEGKLTFVPDSKGGSRRVQEWYAKGVAEEIPGTAVDRGIEINARIEGNSLKLFTVERK
jgi:hypothetical protein